MSRQSLLFLLVAVLFTGCQQRSAPGNDGAAGGADGTSTEAEAPSEPSSDVADTSATSLDPTPARGAGPAVRAGAHVLLEDSIHLVREKRVGLVTNHTGILDRYPVGARRELGHTIDLLHEHPEVELAALFGPEHGLAGRAEGGEAVDHARDERTGVPIHSLYGPREGRKPPPGTLDGLDVLLFDIQDIGARYYTYIYTMALAMEAAGEAGIPFVVLDRPNPIRGDRVQGNVLDPAFATFVGMYPVPMRHGMTPGELARLFRGEFGVEVDLRVVPAEGWRREMTFRETGLPWIAPSPNMPSTTSALHYAGTCLFEGTVLSVARGTDRPFQQIGAPWLDGEELARRLSARGLPGVAFVPVTFTPRSPGDGKFGGEEVRGVRLEATDRATYDPTRTAVALLVEARALAGERWRWFPAHFDRLAGTDRIRLGVEEGLDVDELTREWDADLEAFRRLREPYLIYR